MPMNRIQFQRGLSLPDFHLRFGTEPQCVEALMTARWPSGFFCPRCSGRQASRFTRGSQHLWQCSACRVQTSLTAGTPFADSKLPLRLWYLAMYLVTQAKNGISALELGRQIGVCYRTAWRVKHRLMAVMGEREEERVLDGLVQVDDAYLGGERSGVANGKQWANKIPFVAAVSTHEGRPHHMRLDVLPSFNRHNLEAWAAKAIAPDAVVISDGLTAFQGIQWAGLQHEFIVTGRGRKAAQEPRLKWVNIILSNLKTALSGTHHALKFAKYGARYLAAHQYRFNRRFDLAAMVQRLVAAVCRGLPRTERDLRAETRR